MKNRGDVSATKNAVTVIFEFTVLKPKLTFYRGLKTGSGQFRLEKCGEFGKKFRSVMGCGSERSLLWCKESIEKLSNKN